jgi:ribosomal protein L7/L12
MYNLLRRKSMSKKDTVQEILELIEGLNIKELIGLQQKLQESWGIRAEDLQTTSAAPVAQEADAGEDEAVYNLVATAMKDPTKKIKCTIFLKNTFKLDMQKCKEVLENIASKPVVYPNISKEDAEKFIKDAAVDDIQLVLERVKAA